MITASIEVYILLQIPRSRRTSNKTKEISNNIVAQSTSDKIVCSTIQKSSFHSNLLDQPQDRSQLDKCSNQEQSRKVNSNKVKRSGAMVRRGTTDETQETSKVFKSTSNSSGKCFLLSINNMYHANISCFIALFL